MPTETTFADILAKSKVDEVGQMLLNYTGTNEATLVAQAALKATLIADYFNEGRCVEPGDGYLPYYDPDRNLAFSMRGQDSWLCIAGVGSRLDFIDYQDSNYAGKTFPEVYIPLTFRYKK